MSKIEKLLREYQENNASELINYVVDDILSQDSPITYINDVMYGGCASGMVTSLIYYCDTDKFFVNYHAEILELVENYKNEIGEFPLGNREFNSNNLAWFGYEWTMTSISNMIEEYSVGELEDDEEEYEEVD